MSLEPHTQIHNRWYRKADIRNTVLLTLILTPIIGFTSSYVQVRLMGSPASQVMRTTENLVAIFTWVASPVAALVIAIVLISYFGKRHHGDNPPEEADHQIKNSPRANLVWIITSALLCLFAVVSGMIILEHDNESVLDDKAMRVNVTGQQWVWNYDYPALNGVRSNQLHLVVNKPVVFHVTSLDVKHSFWIVELGVKVDANPGELTEVAVTPNKIGTYSVRCAELCGLLHAYMQNEVVVQSQSDYDAWAASQPRRDFPGAPIPAPTPTGGKA